MREFKRCRPKLQIRTYRWARYHRGTGRLHYALLTAEVTLSVTFPRMIFSPDWEHIGWVRAAWGLEPVDYDPIPF